MSCFNSLNSSIGCGLLSCHLFLCKPYRRKWEAVIFLLSPEQLQFSCFYVKISERPISAIVVKKLIEAWCLICRILTCKHNVSVSPIYSPPSDRCAVHWVKPDSNASKNTLDRTSIATVNRHSGEILFCLIMKMNQRP